MLELPQNAFSDSEVVVGELEEGVDNAFVEAVLGGVVEESE